MLEIKNLSAFYGRRKVLDNISLAFEKGSFHAVIGKNGSGKSTLVNCIAGINKYVGSITYDGSDVSSFSFAERGMRGCQLLKAWMKGQKCTGRMLLKRSLT